VENAELPPFVRAEREALLAEIQEAFPGGSRQGGISWSEAAVLDMYGSPEECAAARSGDRDARWQDLLESPQRRHEPGIGGWSFLDAISFRYYLPAAMVLSIRQGDDVGIRFHLQLPEGELRSWRHDKWSLLNLRQRLCVKRFLQYMAVVDGFRMEEDETYGWTAALTSYWGRVAEDEPETIPPLSTKSRSRRA
jgi:hypothetical protein